jgi:hypothetical protein
VRNQHLHRKPRRPAQLAQVVEERPEREIVDLVGCDDAGRIDGVSHLDQRALSRRKGQAALSVEMLVLRETLDGFANRRGVSHEIALQAEVVEMPHAPGGQPEMSVGAGLGAELEQPPERVERNAVVRLLQRVDSKTRADENVWRIDVERTHQCWNTREAADTLPPRVARLDPGPGVALC